MLRLWGQYEQYLPFWGEATARANFCEEDYRVTPYIAEFINTLSNVVYVGLAYYGYCRYSFSSPSAWVPYAALSIVGFASGLFHATLKQYTQFVDDFSMILGSTVVLYRLLSIPMSARAKMGFAVSLVLLVAVEGYVHMAKDEQTLHELLFAVMLLVICGRTTVLLRRAGPVRKGRERDLRMAIAGAGAIIFGYFLWQLDHRICNQLNTVRHSLGMPWGFLLELHGWWHILTGLGVTAYIILVEKLRAESMVSANHRHKLQ